MHLLATDQLVTGHAGERLMRFVKSDIGLSLPPGIPRYAVSIADDAPIADSAAFASSGHCLVYVNLDPTKECSDEVMEGRFCLSNDRLSCATVISRVVRAVEVAHEIW
jgi:hypothetical protein